MTLRIHSLEVSAYRVPIAVPVETSFGVMTSRPAVFVRLWDDNGAFGWGEIFANWPAAGAEHRARLLIEDMADLVIGFHAEAPSDLFHHLTHRTHVRALQCGEFGPFSQVIAGLDTALHDLWARRAELPLARMLNPQARHSVPSYASGIPLAKARDTLAGLRRDGWRAFKVKIGFDETTEIALLEGLRQDSGRVERLFADANQAWALDEALRFIGASEHIALDWLEEPIGADRPIDEWSRLAKATKTPLAAGENIAGFDQFDTVLDNRHLGVVQPDVAKWGGITGCLHVAQQALNAGAVYCPHFLGGGIGLIASAHLLAAAGGAGLLEVDVNDNPLRDSFSDTRVQSGMMAISERPGLGIEELPEEIAQYRTLTLAA